MNGGKDNSLLEHSNERLAENLEKFRLLYENLPLGYQSLDMQGNLIIVNQAWLDLFGYSNKEEVIGKNFGDFITERDLFVERFPKFKKCGVTHESLFEMVRKDGSRILISIDGRVSYDNDGNFIQTHCILHDVTEKHRRDKALRESEIKYKDLYDNAPDMFVSVDATTSKIRECNQTLATALGYSKDEIIGRPVFDMYHPDSIEGAKKAFQLFKETGEVHNAELQLKRKDGSKIDVTLNVSSVHDKQGNVLYSRSSWRDITERKKVEEALLNEKLLSEDYINSLPGLFYVFDKERFVRWNREWEKVTGYSAEELETRYGPDFFDGEYKTLIKERMFKVFSDGFAEAEAELVTKDGRRIPYYFTGLLKKFNGKSHLIGLGLDITDRRKAEEELKAHTEELERINKAFVGRELKMKALKKEIDELKKKSR